MPVKRVGYSGLMVPVMEDVIGATLGGAYLQPGFAARLLGGVCAGLDTVPLPGDVSRNTWRRFLATLLPWRLSGESL